MGSSNVRLAFRFVLAAVTVLFLGTGCSKASSEPPMGASSAPASSAAVSGSGSVGVAPRDPAHVTTIDITLSVVSVDDASRRVREETTRVDGYVSTMSGSGEGKDRRAAFEARVPAARLGAFRSAMKSLGETKSEDERVEDVGEERADRKARLDNARAEERRILDLLTQRTGSLADVLAAERELARVRETIERFEAQAAALEGKIAFATVRMTLVPRAEVFVERPLERVGAAAKDGVRYANIILVGFVVAVFEVVPTLLWMVLTGAMAWLGFRAVKRLYGRRVASR